MKDWKDAIRRLLFPPIWIVISLAVLSTLALVAVFIKGWETTPIAYGIYVFSFYTLTIICLVSYKIIPKHYKRIKGRVYDNKYANRYLTDVIFKTHVTLYRSLIINMAYVIINAVSGIVYSTHWFGIFAVYYAIMAIMQFLLVKYVRKNKIGHSRLAELRRSRLCAYILLTVNLALSGAVLMMVYFDRGFEYQGFLIYVMALYTFYITITAIRDMIKYRKYKSPVMSVSKIIKMASALFSMLFLETAMFAQFGQDTSTEVKRIMIILTGAGISIIVVAMSIYMIVKTTKEINQSLE